MNDKISPGGIPFSALTLRVQDQLLKLGYSSVGDADGYAGKKTQAAILDFRNRNNLPLSAEIDKAMLAALSTAPRKPLPASQLEKTEKQIATQVDGVKKNIWTRFWAKLAAIPSAVIAVLAGIIGNTGDAINTLSPLKAFIGEWLAGVDKMTLVMGSAGLVTLVSAVLWASSRATGQALTDGYKVGTVRNDLPEEAQIK